MVRSFLRSIIRINVLVTLGLLTSCAPQPAIEKIDWRETPEGIRATEKNFPDEGAVVLQNEGTMEIFIQRDLPFSVFEQHKIIRILTARGRYHANIIIPYTSRSEVTHIEARTIGVNGISTPLDASTIYDVNLYPSFVFYSDQRAKIFTMPAIEDGSIIEYRYRLTLQDPTLWHVWNFQESIPTLTSSFTLLTPAEWDVLYKSYGQVDTPEVKKAPQGFKTTYTWKLEHVPALKPELNMPPQHELLTHISFAPVSCKTWDNVAQWFHSLWKDRLQAGPGIKELVKTITTNVSGNEEKLRQMFNWIQSHIRYIAVEIGIGGYQPHFAEDVYRNRYGDCKDITVLLCSLAEAAGIEMYPAFISTWPNGKADTSLPSPFHFDHVIGFAPSIGEKGRWLDGTDQGCPFGQLPWYDQNLTILLMERDGKGQISTSPRAIPDSNKTLIEWSLSIDTSNLTRITGRASMTGTVASEARNDFLQLSHSDQQRWMEISLAKQCSGANLDSFSISGTQPVQDPFTISYSFTTPSFAHFNGKQIHLQPGRIALLGMPDYFRSTRRVHPVRFRFGEKTIVNLQIVIPKGYTLTTFYRDSVVSSFGKAFWSYSSDGMTLTTTKEYFLTGEEIAPEKYPEFQQFLDEIRKRDLMEISLQCVS
jgi:hypothetical protein